MTLSACLHFPDFRFLVSKGQMWWSYANRLQVGRKISNLVLVTILLLQSQWVSAKTLVPAPYEILARDTTQTEGAHKIPRHGNTRPALETTLRFPVQQSALIPTKNQAGLSQNPIPSRPKVFHPLQDMQSHSTDCPQCTGTLGHTLAHFSGLNDHWVIHHPKNHSYHCC